jgi:hypothetical protein
VPLCFHFGNGSCKNTLADSLHPLSLARKHCRIPGTENFTIALQVIALRHFAFPSIVQKLGAQLAHRSLLVEFDVTQKTKSLADRAGDPKFSGG